LQHDANYNILRAAKPNTYTAVSLFAGAGGMALGLEHAGFSHLLLNEMDKGAVATLRANRPGWPVVASDMRDVDFAHLRGSIDLLEGGFPCQAFSIAGKRLGFRDIRGLMFFEFARAVHEIRPKVVLGENVKGLVSHEGGLTLKVMAAVLQMLGYRVGCKVLRSQYLDVPQKRERLILLAVRKGLDLPLLFPLEREYTISLRRALVGCPASEGLAYSGRKQQMMRLVPEGGNWRDLPEDVQREYLPVGFRSGGSASGVARRLSWDEPSPTLPCAPDQKRTERCHPSETRPLAVREYARVQTFPDRWTFEGSLTSQYRQIGNAVPVNLGYHLGMAVAAMLGGQTTGGYERVEPMPAVVRHG